MPRMPLPQLTCTVILMLSFFCYPPKPSTTGSTKKMVENKTQTHNPNQKRIQPIAITKDNDKGKETVFLPEYNIEQTYHFC